MTEGKDFKSHRSIAIVGAGFGGLTLANYLELNKTSESSEGDKYLYYQYQIFDSKTAPIPIWGPINLPHGRQILSDLGLQLEQEQEQNLNHHHGLAKSSADDGMVVVEQEDFLNLLRSKVDHKIQYSTEIVRVEKKRIMSQDGNNNHEQYYYLFAKHNNIDKPFGPFDVVVAADGLFGLTSSSSGNNNIIPFVIGDARWQHDMWFWDFGTRRRQRGADIAICDAMELGKQIISLGETTTSVHDNDGATEFIPSVPPKILLLLRGKLGLFIVPMIIGFLIQILLLQVAEGKR